MSVKVMSWVWDHSRSRKVPRLVLLAIADCTSDDGCNAYPSITTLARKCGISVRSVQAAIADLVDLGELAVEYNGGRAGTNRYQVLMTAPPQNLHPPAESAPRKPRTPARSAPPPPQNPHHPPAESAPRTVLEPSVEPSEDLPAASRPAPAVDGEIVNDTPRAALALVEPNGGQIVGAWIDHCAAHNVTLPKRLIGQYAKGIGDALREGFSADLVKHALALMLDEGQSNRPSLLPNFLVRVQQGRTKAPRRATPGERAQQRLTQDPQVRDLLRGFFTTTDEEAS